MKKKRTYLYFTVLLVIVAIILIPKIDFGKKQDNSLKANTSNNSSPSIQVKILQAQELEDYIVTNGTILADEEVDLRSEISGRVVKINFREGSKVSKGQLLVKINDADLQAQLNKNLSRLKLLNSQEQRQKVLLERKAISQEDYDAISNELNIQIAEIDYVKAQIEKTEIKAPFYGIIGLRYISEGAYITPTTEIASIQGISNIKIDFSIPQRYFESVKTGDIVKIKLPSSLVEQEASIYAIEPKIDDATRTLQIRARTRNTGKGLMPGNYAEVRIAIEQLEKAIMIPNDALVQDIRGEKVFLYKDGQAISQRVKTGIRTPQSIQIINGLEFGDTLISSAIIQMRDSLPVKIFEFK